MFTIKLHVAALPVHIDGLGEKQMDEIRRLFHTSTSTTKGIIMATRDELTATLAGQATQAEKVKAEILAAIEELKATATTPEQDALLARVSAALGGLDDIVPDPVPA